MILGRSEEGARVGPVTVYYEDMRLFLDAFRVELPTYQGFQLLIRHADRKDQLVLSIALAPGAETSLRTLGERITETYSRECLMFEDSVRSGKIHPLSIEWISIAEPLKNERTGKLRRVADARGAPESIRRE